MKPSQEVPCECDFCCLRRKIIQTIASIIEAKPHFYLIVESPNGAAFPYHPYNLALSSQKYTFLGEQSHDEDG